MQPQGNFTSFAAVSSVVLSGSAIFSVVNFHMANTVLTLTVKNNVTKIN
jgi:hypothetical protein